MPQKLSIRAVSERCHISARTLRFYEEAGILKSCRREGSKYREYDAGQIERLEVILLLRRLSFTVKEITDILNGGDRRFKDILSKRIEESNNQLMETRETNQLLRKLSSELLTKQAGDIKVSEILKEFVYLTKQTERVVVMDTKTEIYEIRIGLGIVTKIVDQMGVLIEKIGKLRSEFEASGKKPLPAIRIRDIKDMPQNHAVLIWDGNEVWRKDYSEERINIIGFSDEVIEQMTIQQN